MSNRFKQWFARKSLERLHAEMLDDNGLRRVLGPTSLTALRLVIYVCDGQRHSLLAMGDA